MEIIIFTSIGHSPNLESVYVRREYRSGFRTIWCIELSFPAFRIRRSGLFKYSLLRTCVGLLGREVSRS